jgi:virginiamycin A acetyltransferase
MKKLIKYLFILVKGVIKKMHRLMHVGRKNIYNGDNLFGMNTYMYNTKWGMRSGCGKDCKIYDTIIGNYTEIAWNVTISPFNHHFNNFCIYEFNGMYDKNKQIDSHNEIFNGYNCKIGHDVWIGCYSIVLSGVEIGNGAIIAANSVVTKSVPAYAIVGGNPAKFIKWRFSKEQILKLDEVQWYYMTEEEIKKKRNELQSIVDFNYEELKYSRKVDIDS